MVIKIPNNNDGFFIFDNVIDFIYTKESSNDIAQSGIIRHKTKNVNYCEYSVFKGGTKTYLDILFMQNNKQYRFYTDKMIYVITDNGNIIDKLSI